MCKLNRFFAPLAAAFLLMAGGAALTQAQGDSGRGYHGPFGIDGLRQATQSISKAQRQVIVTLFENAAKFAGVTIDTGGMFVANREGAFVAAAPAGSPESPKVLAFLQLPANDACAQVLPPDFYIIEFIPTSTGVEPFAPVKDINGRIILSLPVEEIPPPPGQPMDQSAVIGVELTEASITMVNCTAVSIPGDPRIFAVYHTITTNDPGI